MTRIINGFRPPVSNTGGKSSKGSNRTSCSVSIDWISGTVRFSDFDAVMSLLTRAFGPVCSELYSCSPTRGYSHGVATLMGIKLCWRLDSDFCFLVVPGIALRSLFGDQIYEFVAGLQALEFNCTRLDVALDAYSGLGPVSIDALWEWSLQGYLANGRRFQRIDGNPCKSPSDLLEECGDSVYKKLGSPQKSDPRCLGRARTIQIGRRGKSGAGFFTRIYEKGRQYGVWSPWLRIETEFSKKHARKFFDGLNPASVAGRHDKWRQNLISLALYRVGFCLPPRDATGAHREELPEWAALVKSLGAVCLPPLCSRRRTFANVPAFIRQYSLFLAKLCKLGFEDFLELILGMVSRGSRVLNSRVRPSTHPWLGAACIISDDAAISVNSGIEHQLSLFLSA